MFLEYVMDNFEDWFLNSHPLGFKNLLHLIENQLLICSNASDNVTDWVYIKNTEI